MRLNYQTLIENVHDLVFTLNGNGEFTYVNPRLAEFTGRGKTDWLGNRYDHLIYDEDLLSARENLEKTFQGQTRSFEARMQNRDGTAVYFSTNLTPILESGEVVGIVGISRDINERMKLQQELTELKNFNESIIESMQSGLITLDLNERIMSFNSGAQEALEYKSAEVRGMPVCDILGKDATDVILKHNGSTSVPKREVTVFTKSGREVHIGFTVTPRLDDEGNKVGTIISFKDISQIKSMQAEVIRMDRLASLGVLVSGIAHEIRNPLAGIKTITQTLEEELGGDDERKIKLERIVRQVNRLDELLKTFFDYVKPRPPMRKIHHVRDIAHEVLTLVDKKIAENKISWHENYDENHSYVFADFHQIQQVVLNLILNAIDAMEDGGQLTLMVGPSGKVDSDGKRTNKSNPKQNENNGFVEISLTDTGVGIKDKDLENIFNPFFTTKSKGTGLGLSIVYRIVNDHDGKISVNSTVGVGTTISILLPSKELET
ncbi:MAG: PAS domain S-box protein [Calditrichaeota bacterium]|nr:PAS domain S-box protein [Calditrichota bacterium]